MTDGTNEKRRYRRVNVKENCRLTIGNRQYMSGGDEQGIIINISQGGAAVRFAIESPDPPPVGTPVNLYIGGIGDFPSKVMRSFDSGFAVVFRPLKTWDHQLIGKLDSLLAKYEDDQGTP